MLTNSTAEPPSEDAAVALMLKVRAEGCRVSFDRLVNQWRMPVERLCFRMCGNPLDAEDLTQEVFQKLYSNRARYEPTAKFSTFLWSIAANQCRDFLRSRRRRPVIQPDPQFLSEIPQDTQCTSIDRDSRQVVRDALSRLPDLYREVVVLRHYQHMKFEEIGRLLQIPRGTVASRMAKALRLLERELAPYGFSNTAQKFPD